MAEDGEAVRGAILIALIAVLGLPAAAQTQDELRRQCFKFDDRPAVRIAICTKVIEASHDKQADLVRAHVWRASAFRDLGEFDKSLADCERAISLDPTSASGFICRGHTFKEKGEAGRALPDYDRAVAMKPDSTSLYHRCEANAVLDRLEAALADCDAALKLRPGDFLINDSRGMVYLKMKNYRAAIADYNVVLAVDPDFALPLFGRGVARLRSGDRAGGQADIAKAIKEDPEVTDIMAKRGVRP